MAHETDPHLAETAVDPTLSNQLPGEQTPASEPPAKASRFAPAWLLWLGGAIVASLILGVVLFFVLQSGGFRLASAGTEAGSKSGVEGSGGARIPVNTIRPRKKTLERTLVQPGSIRPWAQAELYAKASGYLKTIQRGSTPQMAADIVAQGFAPSGPAIAWAAHLATVTELALWQAPQKDIGAPVTAGELLLEIDSPERHQEVVEKETLVQQRQTELEAAQAALATYEAAIQAAKAQKVQAEAEVRKFESELAFRSKELTRLKELVQSRTIAQEIADEKQHQVNAAVAAWESSQAKVQTAQADLMVVTSKFTAARADLKVKEVLVQAARDGLFQARIHADYSHIYAPFEGIITYRGVDEGDFVQNATSGQARRLMTITAVNKVKVVLQIPEKDAPWVQTGTEATVVLHARTGWQVKGRVARTARLLEPQTLTMQAEIDLENRDRQLLSDMYGNVTLVLQKVPDAQAIPATAVYSRKGENFILQVHDGIARRQRVRIRYDDGKEVEVVKLVGNQEVALDGSEELIVSNKGEIAEGQHVRTVPLSGN